MKRRCDIYTACARLLERCLLLWRKPSGTWKRERAWIGNDEQWQAPGYPVGSGLVERAVAVVINARMKKRGMRWKRANATAVVALRIQRINAEWAAAA